MLLGVFIWESFSSKILTVSITGKACLAHDGQDIILTPLFLKFKDFNISFPILISFTGSSDNETLIVSPIPSINKWTQSYRWFYASRYTKLPASVIPKM